SWKTSASRESSRTGTRVVVPLTLRKSSTLPVKWPAARASRTPLTAMASAVSDQLQTCASAFLTSPLVPTRIRRNGVPPSSTCWSESHSAPCNETLTMTLAAESDIGILRCLGELVEVPLDEPGEVEGVGDHAGVGRDPDADLAVIAEQADAEGL